MVLRRKLTVVLMTVMLVVMSAAPALAGDKPKPSQPTSPRGLENNNGTGFDRPEQAADPQTGRGNRFDHGSPQNGRA